MKPLKAKHLKHAKSAAEAYVNNMFESFQNPGYAGVNFTWERFPSIVARIVCCSLFSTIAEDLEDEYMDHLEYFASGYALHLAQNLVKEREDNHGPK